MSEKVTPTERVRYEVVLHIRAGSQHPTERDVSIGLAQLFAGYGPGETYLENHVGTEVTKL
jgi:hypothetical protein